MYCKEIMKIWSEPKTKQFLSCYGIKGTGGVLTYMPTFSYFMLHLKKHRFLVNFKASER